MVRRLHHHYCYLRFTYIGWICFTILVACNTRPHATLPAPTPTLTPTFEQTTLPAQSPAYEITQLGKGKPESIAWSPDGRLFAVSGTKGIYIYDTATWQVTKHIDTSVYDPKNHYRGEVGKVVFHPDGKSLFFVLIPRVMIYRYDLATGQTALITQNMAFTIKADLVIAPDSASFAYLSITCSELGNISCWYRLETLETSTGNLLHSLINDLSEDEGAIYSANFSQDGRLLAAGSADGLVRLWEAATGNLLYSLHHDSDVYSVAFSPDGKVVASASEDATIRFWDTHTGQILYTLHGFTRGALFVSYLPQGNRILVGMTDGTFHQWSLDAQGLPLERQSVELETSINGLDGYQPNHRILPDQAVLNSNGNSLATLSNANVQVWDLVTGKLVNRLPELNTTINALSFSADGQTLAVGDRNIHLWQVTTKQFIATLPGNGDAILNIAFRPDGRQIASAVSFGPVQIFDGTTHQRIMEVDDGQPVRVAYAPDGELLATASREGIKIWDSSNGHLEQKIDVKTGRPLDLAFSLNGKCIILAGQDGIYVWDLTSGEFQKTVSSAGPLMWRAVLSTQGNLVALDLENGRKQISFFEFDTGKHLYDFRSDEWGYSDLTFSANGRLLSRRNSEDIILSDSSSGQEVLTLPATNINQYIAFSPDGHILAAADGYRGIFQLWDISTAAGLSTEVPHITATSVPTSTSSPSLQLWPSATQPPLTPIEIQPALTPTPQPNAIRPENAGRLQEQGQYGLGRAETAAWSMDGKTLAIGGTRGIYLFTNKSNPAQFFATDQTVFSVALSPDGHLLAGHIATQENSLRVWDIRSGTSLHQFDEKGACQQSNSMLNFSPDSHRLISHCQDGMTREWDMQSGELLREEANSQIVTLGFTPDQSLALIKEALNIRLINVASGEILKTFKMPGATSNNAAFSPDGKTLLVAILHQKTTRWANLTTVAPIADETQLWEVLPGQPPVLRATLSSGEMLYSFTFTPDSRRLATVYSSGLIRILDTESGKAISTIESCSGHLFFSPDSNRLLVLNPAGKIQIWNVTPGLKPRLQQTLDGFGSQATALTFTPDGKTMLAGSTTSFQRWALNDESGWRVPMLSLVFNQSAQAFTISANGKYLAVGGEHGSIQIHDTENGKLLQTLSGHPTGAFDGTTNGYVAVLKFHPNNKWLASGGADQEIRLWDVETGKLLSELNTENEVYTYLLSFSQDGHYLAASGRGRPIQIFDLHTGQRIQKLDVFAENFTFAPDGVTLSVSAEGLSLSLIDIRTGKLIRTLPTQIVAFQHIFSPDGGLLAAINIDDVVIWDVSTGRIVRRIPQRVITSLAFSPDGRQLAIGFGDGVVKIWRIS